jgi:simple sugar transport system ATP-binding protein
MAILELENVSKHFGAIQALTDVSLVLEPGEVVGLMGDNGAGKSTLVKIIAGNFRPSHGAMRMEGAELSMHRPVEARQHGIEIVHQDLALCDNLTAAAYVFL